MKLLVRILFCGLFFCCPRYTFGMESAGDSERLSADKRSRNLISIKSDLTEWSDGENSNNLKKSELNSLVVALSNQDLFLEWLKKKIAPENSWGASFEGSRYKFVRTFRFENGNTLLHYAAMLNYEKVIGVILNSSRKRRYGVFKGQFFYESNHPLNQKNNDGNTPFHVAAERGSVEFLKSATEDYAATTSWTKRGPKYWYDTNNNGNTALEKALQNHLNNEKKSVGEMANDIIEKATKDSSKIVKIVPENKRQRGWDAIYLAAAFEHKDVLELLDSKDFSLARKDSHGMTPLHYLVKNGATKGIKTLLDSAQVKNEEILEARDNDGRTPIFYLVDIGNTKNFNPIIKILADFKANVNAQDNLGYTVLDLIREVHWRGDLDDGFGKEAKFGAPSKMQRLRRLFARTKKRGEIAEDGDTGEQVEGDDLTPDPEELFIKPLLQRAQERVQSIEGHVRVGNSSKLEDEIAQVQADLDSVEKLLDEKLVTSTKELHIEDQIKKIKQILEKVYKKLQASEQHE